MSKVYVVGIGPGNEKYLTLEAYRIIQQSDLLFASSRVCEASYLEGKNVQSYDGKFGEMVAYIEEHREACQIAILVSGDTGYYSLAHMMQKRLENIEIIPGISAFQYLFSKIQKPWQNMELASVHGRDFDLVAAFEKSKGLVLLTDSEHHGGVIAQLLTEAGHGQVQMTIGENLSYPDEKITSGKAVDLAKEVFESLSVVVIEHEN